MVAHTHARTAAVAVLAVAVAGFGLAACGSEGAGSPSDATDAAADGPGGASPVESSTDRPSFDRSDLEELATAEPPSRPTPRIAPPPGDVPPATDELPANILAPVIEDAARRRGVPASQVDVLRSQPARWSDGSLGCPEPGLNYTQAIVDGYWIVLRVDGTDLDYRLGSADSFRLCETGGTPPMTRDDV